MRLLKTVFLGLYLLPGLAWAQSYTLVKDTAGLQKKIREMGARTQSIESDFVQVKNLKMMKNQVSSKGKLYFKKDTKLRWEYTSPFSYIIVLNGNKVSIKNENKVKRYDLEKNKVFKEINDILISCVQGTILHSGKFDASLLENSTGYKVELIPKKESMRKTLSKIVLYLDRQVTAVTKMEMAEPSGDSTAITFSNRKINTTIPETLFILK